MKIHSYNPPEKRKTIPNSSMPINGPMKADFKQELSKLLRKIFSSRHLDQGIDISVNLLSKPLDFLNILNLNIKESHPEIYNLLKEIHHDKSFSKLGLRLEAHCFSEKLHKFLHRKITEENDPEKLSKEISGTLTNLILINNSDPKNESSILNNFVQNINKLFINIELKSIPIGLQLALDKSHFLNDATNGWANFCEKLNIKLDPKIKILSTLLSLWSKVAPKNN